MSFLTRTCQLNERPYGISYSGISISYFGLERGVLYVDEIASCSKRFI
jgi:hypothetical protein